MAFEKVSIEFRVFAKESELKSMDWKIILWLEISQGHRGFRYGNIGLPAPSLFEYLQFVFTIICNFLNFYIYSKHIFFSYFLLRITISRLISSKTNIKSKYVCVYVCLSVGDM